MNQKQWEKLLKKTAKLIHDGELKPEDLSIDMVQMHAKELYKGVLEGYSIESSNLGAEDEKVLNALKNNVFVFSGFKNYQQLKEMSSLLTDTNNKVRSFNDFYKDVKAVDKTYNKLYLEAEYQHAISTSTSIAQWQRIQEDKEDAPYLEYVAVMDERTRDAHRSLDGTIRKVDDPFWDKYYPPNGWRCRCDVIQHVDAEETPADKIEYPDTPLQDMFSSNAGKENIVFPTSHPYYNVNAKTKTAIKKSISVFALASLSTTAKNIERRKKQDEIFPMPYSKQFNTVIKNKNGGVLREHKLLDKTRAEYKGNRIVAEILIENGHKIDLLPIIHHDDVDYRKKILPNTPYAKNPDYKINGVEFELETAYKATKSDLFTKIQAGALQANCVVIKIEKPLKNILLKEIAAHKFEVHKNLKELMFITSKGKIYQFKR